MYHTKRIPFYDGGYYFDGDGIGSSPLHHAGGIYIQDPSAMASIASLGDRTFENVFDTCASPGGKSLGAYLKMNGKGVLVSNEYVPSRCKTLVGNVERFGIKNAIVTSFDMTQRNELCDIYEGFFDLVICDAPCSGEGMFRKYPEEAIGEWSVENVLLCAERQKNILDNAATFVKGGGFLLYSTCTFSLEENEMQADSFLTRHPEFELIPLYDKVIGETAHGIIFDGCVHRSVEHTRRFYPHLSDGEGQFIALFRKSVEYAVEGKRDKYKSPLTKPFDSEFKILSEFVKKHMNGFDLSKVFRAAPRIIDIHAKGVSKAAAARQLQKDLGRKILVCVGDAENDLAMLQEADYAFCPSDGIVADRFPNVCNCAEGAVADVIYKKIPEILGLQP